MRRWLLRVIGLIAMISASPLTAFGAATSGPQMLPAGFLSTRGSQIVGRSGVPVRIACVGGFGTVIVGGRLGYSGPYQGLDANLAAVKKTGFNCLRVDFNDKSVDDSVLMAQFDQLVAGCRKYGLKVIFDHHNNEATAADWGNAAQQTNGLWFDVGQGTDGTDGAKDKGTISSETFRLDWVKMARHWAGNSTVIGFDLDNEPHNQYGHNSENWGEGGPCDIWAMYTQVGDAIQAVDPGALIICEGFADVTDKSSNIWWTMDLTHVAARPVVLNIPHKVVYSVHEYPYERNGGGGPSYVARMNEAWGYLIRRNLAPVWIGEMGASLDAPDEGGHVSIADQQGWAKTLLDYMNGTAPNGLRFANGQQPVSGDWWLWGCRTGESPDGCLTPTGQVRPEQAPYIARMLFQPQPTAQAGIGIWQPYPINGMQVNLLLPDHYSPAHKYPVVLYLHQLDMGNWPDGLLKEINPWFNTAEWRQDYPAIVVSPLLDQKSDPSGKSNNFGGVSPEDQSGEDNAIAAVRQVLKQYSGDPTRVYVTGNSMGGIGTWDLLIKYNAISGTAGRIFAAGMPLAGATYDHGYPTPDASVVSDLKNVPIWAIHGAGDTQVPPVWDKAMAAALSSQSTFHFTLDPTLSHDVWDSYYALPTGKACWDWLFAQKATRQTTWR